MNLNNVNSLVLAYMGDSIYERRVREYLIKQGINKVNLLQKKAVTYVSAKSQYEYLMKLISMNFLSESEMDVVKRGRNAKSKSVPRNVNITIYRYATGFEALIGYLYFKKNEERIDEIFKFILKGD